MVYLLETEVSKSKKIRNSLKKIYGLGKPSLDKVCYSLGITKTTRMEDLSEFKIKQIIKYINTSGFCITSELRKNRNIQLKHLISIKCQKGLRKIKGLPVRGQRTHTNAKNAKKRVLSINYEINIHIN